ncbi:TPA: hypothetical protein RSW61_001917 [Vibrio harveyi]|nr:hypothetical protein [Vibrio harveyi]
MKFYNLDKTLGIDNFLLPHNINLIKSEDQSLEEYRDWLDTFTYLHNEIITVALRPHGRALEFHFIISPSATIKNKINALQSLSELLRGCPLVTYIGMNNKRLMDFCCNRFGFTKSKWCGFVEADGKKHRRFQMTRDPIYKEVVDDK